MTNPSMRKVVLGSVLGPPIWEKKVTLNMLFIEHISKCVYVLMSVFLCAKTKVGEWAGKEIPLLYSCIFFQILPPCWRNVISRSLRHVQKSKHV